MVNLKRVESGEYRGEINGVPVLVKREALGTHRFYHTFSHQPHWVALHAVEGGQVLSDGNGTKHGAIEGAKVAIQVRKLA